MSPVPGDNPDKAVFRLLERFDQHLGDRHHVNFYLYFPSQRKAEWAVQELLCLGLTAELLPFKNEKKWLCLASKQIVPTLNALTGLRKVLEDVAFRCGGKYDGWETAILE